MYKLSSEKIAEINNAFLKKNGFTNSGCTWVILGDTYSIKDELKALGCKFCPELKWHAPHPIDGYKCMMVSVDELVKVEGLYVMQFKHPEIVNGNIRIKNDAIYSAQFKSSNHVGNIGDKVSIDVEVKESIYSRNYGFYIYKFSDANGNLFTWKTGNYYDLEKGQKVNLRGTIKNHSEYRMVKENILTRCKIN